MGQGIIHRAREAQEKRNKIVYGVTTDGNQYQFWRIDNDSVVSDDTTGRGTR